MEDAPIEKGTIVASQSAPETAIGYVETVVNSEVVELMLYSGGSAVECQSEDVVASPQWYVACEWDQSKDKACNVRREPTMDSEKVGSRKDGDRELITHEFEGFLRICDVGWVRKKGNYTGAWMLGADVESRESTPTPKSGGSGGKLLKKNEHEIAVAEKARLMKKAFLEGVSVEEALERVNHNNPCSPSLLSSVSHSSPRVGVYNEASLPSSLRTPSSLSSPVSPASRGARVRIMEPSEMQVSDEPLSPGPTPAWTSGEKYSPQQPTRSTQPSAVRKHKGIKRPGPVIPPPPPPPSPKYQLDAMLQNWLVHYHLSPFAHVFAEHEVDIVVLPTLTYGDLVEMRLPPNVCRAIVHALRNPDDKPLLERPRRQRSPTRRARFSA